MGSTSVRTKVLEGDVAVELKKLSSNLIDLIVTSPPYAGSRKDTYGGIAPDDYVAWFLGSSYHDSRSFAKAVKAFEPVWTRKPVSPLAARALPRAVATPRSRATSMPPRAAARCTSVSGRAPPGEHARSPL